MRVEACAVAGRNCAVDAPLSVAEAPFLRGGSAGENEEVPGWGAFRVHPTASWSWGGLRPVSLGLVRSVTRYLRPAPWRLFSVGRKVDGGWLLHPAVLEEVFDLLLPPSSDGRP